MRRWSNGTIFFAMIGVQDGTLEEQPFLAKADLTSELARCAIGSGYREKRCFTETPDSFLCSCSCHVRRRCVEQTKRAHR